MAWKWRTWIEKPQVSMPVCVWLYKQDAKKADLNADKCRKWVITNMNGVEII